MTSIFSSSTDGTPWLVRTDFTDQGGWESVCAAAAADPSNDDDVPPADSFRLVDDPEFEGLTAQGLLSLEPYAYESYFLVDRITMTHPEHPILAVDVDDEPGRSFRLIPSAVPDFAVNMLLANMDFADFADGVSDDGIFRGFGPDPYSEPSGSGPTEDEPVDEPTTVDSQFTDPGDSTRAPTIRLAYCQFPADEPWPFA